MVSGGPQGLAANQESQAILERQEQMDRWGRVQ